MESKMTRMLATLMGLGWLLGLPIHAQEQEAPPRFKVDPFWPKTLPNNWMLGHVEGIVVAADGNIWMLHHSSTMDHPHHHSKVIDHSDLGLAQDPPISECCLAAPEVIEFDPAGNVLRAWGGHGYTPDWPEAVHGFWVDKQKNVWITGNHAPDRLALKFSPDGKKLLKIGEFTEQGGRSEKAEPNNQDTTLLGGPTALTVDDEAHEVYIADGSINKRVVVYDSNTGKFKRGWGAYGIPLSEIPNTKNSEHEYDPVTPSKQFNKIDTVRVSRDGFVYVSDKGSNRVQVFTKAGKFLKEFFVARETLAGPGTTFGMAFSHDPDQKYLFVADGSNNTIRVVDRKSGTPVTRIGRQGRNAGQLDTPVPVAVDSHGNLFVGEVKYNNRIQKFVLEK
jgi:sugar lactone lactonase YvrE